MEFLYFFLNFYLDIAFESITNETNNWSDNQDCFNELDAIKNGLNNFNEWAIESIVQIVFTCT